MSSKNARKSTADPRYPRSDLLYAQRQESYNPRLEKGVRNWKRTKAVPKRKGNIVQGRGEVYQVAKGRWMDENCKGATSFTDGHQRFTVPVNKTLRLSSKCLCKAQTKNVDEVTGEYRTCNKKARLKKHGNTQERCEIHGSAKTPTVFDRRTYLLAKKSYILRETMLQRGMSVDQISKQAPWYILPYANLFDAIEKRSRKGKEAKGLEHYEYLQDAARDWPQLRDYMARYASMGREDQPVVRHRMVRRRGGVGSSRTRTTREESANRVGSSSSTAATSRGGRSSVATRTISPELVPEGRSQGSPGEEASSSRRQIQEFSPIRGGAQGYDDYSFADPILTAQRSEDLPESLYYPSGLDE
jgi:hypothetical protein